MDYLFSLTERLAREPALRPALLYRPSSSLYRAAGKLRYVEARVRERERTYHLVAVDDTPYLSATLERARDGARAADLAEPLVSERVSLAAAERFIDRLIDTQVL